MKILLVVALLVASGYTQDLSVASAQAACGPVDTQFVVKTNAGAHSLQQPDAGKALVYVVVEQKFKAVRDVTSSGGA